jgi:hypothetical protein
MYGQHRPAEMIGNRSFLSPERTTSWLTASPDRDGDDIQAAEAGEAHGDDDYYDDPATPRWRDRLIMGIAVIALGDLGPRAHLLIAPCPPGLSCRRFHPP